MRPHRWQPTRPRRPWDSQGKNTEYIMLNAGLHEAQAGINIVGRNINDLRYAYNINLMAEIEEEPKSLLMRVKEESGKSWFKTQHSKS